MSTEDPILLDGVSEPAAAPGFFSSQEFTQCLDLLRHLTENTALVPVVTGEQGAGKSALLRQFQSYADEGWQLQSIEANPMMHPQQLLTALAVAFGVRGEEERLAERLVERFALLRQREILPIVTVDDAHLLPVATLEELFRLLMIAEQADSVVRLVLFASPSINALLEAPSLQALSKTLLRPLPIPPLAQEHVGPYIDRFLEGLGLKGALVLSVAQLERLYRESQGLPGRLEVLVLKMARQGTLMPAETAADAIPAPRLKSIWIGGGVVFCSLLIALLVFQSEINRLFGTEGSSGVAMDQGIAEEAQTVPLSLPPEGSTPPPVASDSPTLAQETVLPVAEEPEPVQVLPMEEVEPVPEVTPPAPEAVLPLLEDIAAPAPLSEPIASVEPLLAMDMEASTPSQEGSTESGSSVPEIAPVLDAPVKPEAEKADAPALQLDQPSTPVPDESLAIKRETWLLKQKPSGYTLQLIGVTEEAAILAFVKKHQLEGDVAYFQTTRQGKPWFSLLYGVYADRKAAVEARSQLPSSLRGSDAWPRTFASIHKEVRPH